MNKGRIYPWYFTIGAVLLYCALFFIPGIMGIYYSFTDWNGFSFNINFVGLDNYRTIFSGNSLYLFYISNTLKFTLTTTAAKTLIGFMLALLFTSGIKAANLHRTVVFSPQVLSFLITGLVFRSMLHPSQGFLNNALRGANLDFLAQNWLGSLQWAFTSVMAVDTWKGVGYIMVIFIAGLQAIPRGYYEAAEIDGASAIQKVFNISLPLLVPSIAVATVLNITYGLRVFDIIYVLTNGGPGYATGVINTAVFKEFSDGRYGVGTALSTVLFLFVMLISYFLLKALNAREVEL